VTEVKKSDYVRDLMRHDRVRVEKVAHIQKLVTKGLESGITKSAPDDILVEARKLATLSGRYAANVFVWGLLSQRTLDKMKRQD